MNAPRKTFLTPKDTFSAELCMSENGDLMLGPASAWHQRQHATPDGTRVPLQLDPDSKRPYYEEHWADIIKMQDGDSKAKTAVLRRLEAGQGNWAGPPDKHGRRQPIACQLLAEAFKVGISDAKLIQALAHPIYSDTVGQEGTLLEMALRMRLFRVAERMWEAGFRPPQKSLDDGSTLGWLAWPRPQGKEASVCKIVRRLAGPNKKHASKLEQEEENWKAAERGWAALIETTRTWIERLDQCGTAWTSGHSWMIEHDDGNSKTVKLPWLASVYRFGLRDYDRDTKKNAIDMSAMSMRPWQTMWLSFCDRIPPEILIELRCQIDDNPISVIDLVRQYAPEIDSVTLEQSALDRLSPPAQPTHRKPGRL